MNITRMIIHMTIVIVLLVIGFAVYTVTHPSSIISECNDAGGVTVRTMSGEVVCIRPEAMIK